MNIAMMERIIRREEKKEKKMKEGLEFHERIKVFAKDKKHKEEKDRGQE